MAPKPPKSPKKVKRDAANAIGLVDTAVARVRLSPQSVGHELGLHQALSACIGTPPPAPADQSVGHELGLHQTLEAWITIGAAAPEPLPLTGWDRIHSELFVTRDAARGRSEELLSAVLLCLHSVDAEPPKTVQDAANWLEDILRGTNAADRVGDVLGLLRPGLRLLP